MPKVSVIVPVYNVENYLKESLCYITNQTLKDIEIICIDDGSTDNSLDILKEYAHSDKRIKILTQQNCFAGVARNNGLKIASGKYIIFLDSDDIFDTKMLEKMYNRAEKTDSDITVCQSKIFYGSINNAKDNNSINFKNIQRKELFSGNDIADTLFQTFAGWPWDKLYKRDFVLKHGLQFQSIKSSNDTFFVLSSLTKAKKISTIQEYLIYYRNDNFQSINKMRKKFSTCFYEALVALKAQLVDDNIYEIYHQSFMNYILTFSLWHFSVIYDYTECCKFYNFLKKSYFKEFDLKTLDKNQIYNKKQYKIYKKIMFFPNYLVYSLFNIRNIFSISNRDENKVLTILGMKIKFKRKKK